MVWTRSLKAILSKYERKRLEVTSHHLLFKNYIYQDCPQFITKTRDCMGKTKSKKQWKYEGYFTRSYRQPVVVKSSHAIYERPLRIKPIDDRQPEYLMSIWVTVRLEQLLALWPVKRADFSKATPWQWDKKTMRQTKGGGREREALTDSFALWITNFISTSLTTLHDICIGICKL